MPTIDSTTWRSPNHSPRPAGVTPSAIVLHSCEGRPRGAERSSSLPWLCNDDIPLAERVSCHYYVCRSGVVYQLVADGLQAWHAGRGSLLGDSNWNDNSIGIELEHAQHAAPYPLAQRAALVDLLRELVLEHGIARERVVAHRAVAAGRKIDPTDLSDAEIAAIIATAYAPQTPTIEQRVSSLERRVTKLEGGS